MRRLKTALKWILKIANFVDSISLQCDEFIESVEKDTPVKELKSKLNEVKDDEKKAK